MRYRRLDANGDYSMGHGSADWLVDSPEAVAQAAKTRLWLYTGEWFLDVTEGTPWRTKVLGRNPEAAADLALRARILGTAGVTGIAAYSSSLTTARAYSLTATITTTYGTTDIEVSA